MKIETGDRVMVDHNTLQKRPDGRSGIGGILVLYGIKRLTCNVVSVNSDRVQLNPIGTIYTITVKHEDCMKYDPANDAVVGAGNAMYDNEPIDLS